MTSKLVVGMKVRYLPQPEWGVGHLISLEDGSTKAAVLFPERDQPVLVSTRQGQVHPVQLTTGETVRTTKGAKGAVVEEVEGGRGLRRYVVRLEDGSEDEWPESELRALPPKPDALTLLKQGRVGEAKAFLLRKKALHLDDERRCDALGALLASRVMVKPHQVGVVQRVLSARRPRFILADEVGLGKTIEAGMVLSALRLSGLASRVLVVAPSHLSVQWLVELFHKFNQLFTLMDGDRYASSLKERPDVSPWNRFDKVVTSLEFLSRTDEHRAQAAATGAFWDLVIFDEAHHLKGGKAFETARALAKNSWGLLLLTATPMQLDPEEYHSLLTLVDQETAPTLEGFRARLSRQEQVSAAVRRLLDEKVATSELKKLAGMFPGDAVLAKTKNKDLLLAHLAETYSLSERLIRNRRVVVGGFAPRRLHRHRVALSAPESQARAAALELCRTKGKLRGAPLANLLRRLESSPAALLEAVKGTQALADLKDALKLPERDAKYAAFVALLGDIWKKEPGAKALVFTEARDTLEHLRARLLEDRIEPLVYHGDLALVERDRQVARFRDPDGPKVLLCTEVGGEGRNFQFSHHLVNYDLPWSPATMEQRIGRLDRIGQTKPVDIHVFDVEGTLSADVLEVLDKAVGVFGETVGGLDAVLEEVEPRLTLLALAKPEERAGYVQELKERVEAAREAVRKAYDPLLDQRSFDRAAVEVLVRKALHRFGIESEDEDETIEDQLWTIARDLDERLEETVTDLAKKVGIGVDTDEHVEAFQCAFHFGHELTVEALPGISLGEDKVVTGSFWRDTAIEQEENDYFATGHPIVEALFGFLRDGPYGRSGARYLEMRGPRRARGLEVLFHINPPEAEDTSPGAKVPSRQLARFLDELLIHVAVVEEPGGAPKSDPSLLELLEQDGRPLKGDEVQAAFPGLARFVDPAMAEATRAAETEMKRRAAVARAAIEEERDAALERMKLALTHQGVSQERITAQLGSEKRHYQQLLDALAALRLTLDSVGVFAVNR